MIIKVVTLIPIVRGLPVGELTYFSTFAVAVGDIATVSIQSRSVRGLVVTVDDVRTVKAQLKRGEFILRRVESVKPGFISPTIVSAAKKTAEYFATSLTRVLGAIYSKNVMAEAERIKSQESRIKSQELRIKNGESKTLIPNSKFLIQNIEGTQMDRLEWIKKNILPKHARVLYIAPSNDAVARAKEFFKNKKNVVCASPEYGFVRLSSVDAVILDDESGPGYLDKSSARINFKKVYEYHARENNQTLVIADSVLALKYFVPGSRVSSLSEWPSCKVVVKEKSEKHDSWLVSAESLALVKRATATGGRVLFYAPRKGVATITICKDCGELAECAGCRRPWKLARRNGINIFVCPSCGDTRPSNTPCVDCGSWRLLPLGITVESLASELERLLPTVNVLRISRDNVKSKTALKQSIKRFESSTCTILVATELVIPFLKGVDVVVISSVDQFVVGRSLSGMDKAMRLIFDIASLAHERVNIETAHSDQEFFANIASGDPSSYRKREMEDRQNCNFPPFGIIVKIDNKMHLIKSESWPDAELVKKIRSLPRGSEYTIDADTVV